MKKLILALILILLTATSVIASDGGAQFIAFGTYFNASSVLYPTPKIYHYGAGGTTLKNCWSDEGKTSAVAQPFVGDAYGVATMYCDGDYKFVVKDVDSNTLYTWDNVKITSDTATMWEGNFGLSYPSATSTNRWQQFAKHDTSNNFLELGINDGDGFVTIVYPPLYVDVKAYGAKCDGVTNDATAIQTALNEAATTGKPVIISGTCAVGSAGWVGLSISSKNNITIKGASKSSGFKLLAAPTQYLPSNGAFSKTWFKFTSCSKLTITGLTFDTNSINANIIGLVSVTDSEISHNYVNGTTGTDLAFVMTENCERNWYYKNTIIGAYHAFILGRAGNAGTEEQYSSVERNVIKNTGNASISYTGLYGDISYNKIINCGMDGISANPMGTPSSPTTESEGLNIVGNTIITAAGEGINLEAVGGVTAPDIGFLVADNYIKSANTGISVNQVVDTIIRGNRIINSIGPGINLSPRPTGGAAGDTHRFLISGNTLYDTRTGANRTQTNGIYATTGTAIASIISDLTITENIVTNNSGVGIQAVVQGSPQGTGARLSITGNQTNDNGSWGISVNGVWSSGIVSNNIALGNFNLTGMNGDINISSSVTAGALRINGNWVGNGNLLVGSPQIVDGYLAREVDNVETSGTGEDVLHTTTIPAYLMGKNGGLHITASGYKGGTGNGNKTIKFYFGTVVITVVPATTGTDSWRIEVDVFNMAATNAQRISYVAYSGTTISAQDYYEAGVEDTTQPVIIKITGEVANALDYIGQQFWIIQATDGLSE